MAQKIRFMLLTGFKTNFLLGTPIYRKCFWRFPRFASLFQKNGIVFVHYIWQSKAFNQYSMTQKIRFMHLTGSKANLWGTPYREKAVGAFQSLSRFSRKMVLYLSTKLGIIKP